MNWTEVFGLSMSPLELMLRGTLVYWLLFLIFRFVLRRDVGAVGVADILLLVLIADAAQNAMAGGYRTVTDGAILILTIVGWNWLLDWASFHWPAIARLAVPEPLVLVRRGQFVYSNLEREHLTPEEVLSKLRAQGIDKLSTVRIARLEPDGEISVLEFTGRKAGRVQGKGAGPAARR
jgi:uncharacterized membrane protein YcaP (DUF421 family)